MTKHINIEITRCSTCPFAIHEQRTLHLGEEGRAQPLVPAWYCVHPVNRHGNDMSCIVTENEMMICETWTLTEYCQKFFGSNFPEMCPLPDRVPHPSGKSTGKRRIEL